MHRRIASSDPQFKYALSTLLFRSALARPGSNPSRAIGTAQSNT